MTTTPTPERGAEDVARLYYRTPRVYSKGFGDITTHKVSTKAPAQPVELTLKGHEELVTEVAFILSTRLLVTGSDDESLRVWDLDTGKQVGEPLLGHDAMVYAVSASPDGRWIASGGRNGSILVWEVATNERELKRVPVSFEGHENLVEDIVFAPDNKTFASASWDETVCVWKRETGKIVLGPLKVGNMANSVSYSPDGTKLAAGTHKHIIIWNSASGEELLKIEQRAWRVAFTPDGLRLVSGNRKDIRISDATTGDIIKQFDAHTEDFTSLAVAPNGTKFATTSGDKTTRFFDLANFEPIGEPLEHPDVVVCVAFSEDSKLIATGCWDGHVRTWTVPLSESEKELEQSTQKILNETIPDSRPRPKRAPLPINRFFDDFDPTERNNHAGTTRKAKGSKIKHMIDRIFSRSSASQDQTPRSPGVPLVEVSATRGKYRTANAHSGKRDGLLKAQRPPRNWQGHAGASSSSTPPAETSNVVNKTVPATLQTGNASASTTANHPSPLNIEHIPGISCFTILTSTSTSWSHITSIVNLLVYYNDWGIREIRYIERWPSNWGKYDTRVEELGQDLLHVRHFCPASNDKQVPLRDEDMEAPIEERGSSGGCFLPTKVLVEEHQDARDESIDIIVKTFESGDAILQCALIEHVRGNSDKQERMQTNSQALEGLRRAESTVWITYNLYVGHHVSAARPTCGCAGNDTRASVCSPTRKLLLTDKLSKIEYRMAANTQKDGHRTSILPTQEETSQPTLTLVGHEEWVSGVVFIPRTNLLVTSSADKTLRVWNLDTGKQVGDPLLNHDCAVWKVAASPDGRWIVSGGWNGSILLWEIATDKTDLKREPVSFKGHEILLRGLAFAPDSETFASASNDLTVCVWKRETGQIVVGPLRLGELPNSVSYSHDGKNLAAGTDKHIIVWNATNGEELLKIQKRAYRIAFTPDSLRLVSGDWNNIRITDVATGDIIKQFDAHNKPCQSLAISPNGSKFATTSTDKTTRFFDMNTFEPIGKPLEHPDVVLCVAFSEDSQLIVTSCEDKLIRTWTVPLDSDSLRRFSSPAEKSGSTLLAVTSIVVDETTLATLQTGNTSAASNPPSPLDVEHMFRMVFSLHPPFVNSGQNTKTAVKTSISHTYTTSDYQKTAVLVGAIDIPAISTKALAGSAT
ncbi:WD40 repeat-like protein [Suillus hirtellus]|nr:WD40 repeat-like protein [Suillus hirtellus]